MATRRDALTLSTHPQERKQTPIATGCVDYFPDALAAVAAVSFVGNEQHNPGTPLHWDRSKSGDEADALMRHFVERGTLDADGARHTAKVAWRALAMLQKEIEGDRPPLIDPALMAAAMECWGLNGPDRTSPHVSDIDNRDVCICCKISRAEASTLGQTFSS